jgi:hypothetical protein
MAGDSFLFPGNAPAVEAIALHDGLAERFYLIRWSIIFVNDIAGFSPSLKQKHAPGRQKILQGRHQRRHGPVIVGRIKKNYIVAPLARSDKLRRILNDEAAAIKDAEPRCMLTDQGDESAIMFYEVDRCGAPADHFESECAAAGAEVGSPAAGEIRRQHVGDRLTGSLERRPEGKILLSAADDPSPQGA